MKDSGYTASVTAAKPSEHQIGTDVLEKQRAAEDAAREQARNADERAQQRMELEAARALEGAGPRDGAMRGGERDAADRRATDR